PAERLDEPRLVGLAGPAERLDRDLRQELGAPPRHEHPGPHPQAPPRELDPAHQLFEWCAGDPRPDQRLELIAPRLSQARGLLLAVAAPGRPQPLDQPVAHESATTARPASPNRSSFASPTPEIGRSAASEPGRSRAMPASVA